MHYFATPPPCTAGAVAGLPPAGALPQLWQQPPTASSPGGQQPPPGSSVGGQQPQQEPPPPALQVPPGSYSREPVPLPQAALPQTLSVQWQQQHPEVAWDEPLTPAVLQVRPEDRLG